MKLQGMVIVWPRYFDVSLSRSFGRRVPRSLAIEKPRLSDLREAAEHLGMSFREVKDARHPTRWWEPSGYLILERRLSKESTLRLLAKELRARIGESKEKT